MYNLTTNSTLFRQAYFQRSHAVSSIFHLRNKPLACMYHLLRVCLLSVFILFANENLIANFENLNLFRLAINKFCF